MNLMILVVGPSSNVGRRELGLCPLPAFHLPGQHPSARCILVAATAVAPSRTTCSRCISVTTNITLACQRSAALLAFQRLEEDFHLDLVGIHDDGCC